jgi:hypothetical protein
LTRSRLVIWPNGGHDTTGSPAPIAERASCASSCGLPIFPPSQSNAPRATRLVPWSARNRVVAICIE